MAGMFVPQMVASTGSDPLSGLANLTSKIGQWREDAQLADIMKGLDPANPYSYEDTLHRLATSGLPGGKEMQDRILGIAEARRKAQETEQHGTYQQGTLDVAKRRLQMEQDLVASGRANTEWGQKFLNSAPPQPAVGSTPSSAVTPPETEGPPLPPSQYERLVPGYKPRPGAAAPTIMKPVAASAAPEESVAPVAPAGTAALGAPATTAAPLTRTANLAAPMGGATVSDAGGGAPTPAVAPVQMAARVGGGGGRGAVPPPATGMPPPVPPAPVTAPPPAAVETAPAAREPGIQGSFPTPGLTKAPPERIGQEEANLNAAIDYYTRGSANLSNPSQIKAADKIIDQLTKRRDAIVGAREEAAKQEAEARKELRKKINEGEAADLTKMKEDYNKKAEESNDMKASIGALKAISDHPDYLGGALQTPAHLLSGMAMAWRQIAEKAGVLDKMPYGGDLDKFVQGYVTDVNVRIGNARSLGNAITLKMAGGSLGKDISSTDRTFIHAIGAGADDSREGIRSKALLLNDMADKDGVKADIVNDLSSHNYTATQIRQALRQYEKEREGYTIEHPDGTYTLTEKGRRISPRMAKDLEDVQAANLARRETIEGPGIELGKRADAAAMAAGVNIPGDRATPQGASDRPYTPPGPGKRALIEALGPDKGEAVHAAIGQARDVARSAYDTAAPIAREVARRAVVEPAREMLTPVTNDIRDLFRGSRALPPPMAPPLLTMTPQIAAEQVRRAGAARAEGGVGPAPSTVAPVEYRGPGAPLPPASAAPPPTAPYASGSEVAQPAAAVVGAPPLTAGERFDAWVRGKINPAEAIPRPEAPAPRPAPIEAAVVPTAAGRRRGDAIDAARRARGIVPEPQRYSGPLEAFPPETVMPTIAAIGAQGAQRWPNTGGLPRPVEQMRRSRNIEYQPVEYPSLVSNYTAVDRENLAERNLQTLPPRGRLSEQGGLADLEAYARRPNAAFGRGYPIPEDVTTPAIRRGDEERAREEMLRQLMTGPLPRPARDNSARASKATVERESRRRDRRTPE